ncbi:MAG: hypothetical protein HOM11_09490 [Methylococcales bacterium]|jgi:hypothetical protein|nr:hypothetical protein [Methylococcales bacterium]MBT7444469.1 hypothetical protein [Methylococcales bacterium]
MNKQLSDLCDLATEAHTQIQQNFKEIDPVVGVSHNMRENGVPADVMTIDCLKSGKRIIIVLHDQAPDSISYQFSYKEKDPGSVFEQVLLSELTVKQMYDWMSSYFSSAKN